MIKKLTFILLFFGVQNAFAGNIYGSDIFWKRLSNDTFQIRFEIYNDCEKPIDSINPEIIAIQCSPMVSVKFGKAISHIRQNVTPRCYHDHSKCEVNPTLPYGMDVNIFI